MNKSSVYKSWRFNKESRVLKGKMFANANNKYCYPGMIDQVGNTYIVNNDQGEYATAIFDPDVFIETARQETLNFMFNKYTRN